MLIPLWFTTVEGAKITSGLFWSRTNCSSWSEPCESLCGSYGTPFTSLMSPWPRHLVKFSAFFSIKFVMNFFLFFPRTASHDSAVMCLATHVLAGALLRSLGQIWFPRDLVGIMHISENGIRTKWYNTNYADGLSCSRWNEANAPIWLASWEGKMGMSCPLSVPQEQMSFGPVNEFFVDQDGFDIDIDFWLFFSVLKAPKKNLANNRPFNSAESASGQDEANPAFWLATNVGAARKFHFLTMWNILYWPSSFSLFLVHTDLDFFSANKIAKKNLSNIERSLPSLLCFTLYLRAISKYKPPGAYIWRGDLTQGFLRYEFGGWWGLILGGAYTWKSLFSEFYGILHYEWRTFYLMVFNTD